MEQTKNCSQKRKRCEKFVKKISSDYQFEERSTYNILVIKKINVQETIMPTVRAIKTLQNYSLNIFLEESAVTDIKNLYKDDVVNWANLKVFNKLEDENKIDLAVTIGGDGTILWTCSLFQNRLVPPIITFGMGTLGFMCNYDVTDIEKILNCMMEKFFKTKSLAIEKKMRLKGTIDSSEPNGRNPIVFHSLNDVVIDRGPSPIFCNLDIYLNDTLLTVSSGDGLILSTPTGSTAYSLSAGGPIVHNYLRTIMLVPICPHSLSFRSLLLPSDVNIKIKLSQDSRCKTASVSGDGRNSYEIKMNDILTITSSQFDAQIVCDNPEAAFDKWIEKLQKILMWNSRFIKL